VVSLGVVMLKVGLIQMASRIPITAAPFRNGRKPPDKLLITKRFAVKGSALDREDRASRDAGAVEIVAASTVGSRNEAQRAPARRQGFVDVFRECAQTSFARIAKTPGFSAESFEGDGLKNRRLAPCKISIREVLISVRLNLRGEVAERLKAAVC
jgi:hypothetical protein